MSLFGKFFSPPKPRDAQAAARIKQWVREAMQTDIEVTVSEIDCNDLACPGIETIILIMRPNKATKAIKVSKAMDLVDECDVVGQIL